MKVHAAGFDIARQAQLAGGLRRAPRAYTRCDPDAHGRLTRAFPPSRHVIAAASLATVVVGAFQSVLGGRSGRAGTPAGEAVVHRREGV